MRPLQAAKERMGSALELQRVLFIKRMGKAKASFGILMYII